MKTIIFIISCTLLVACQSKTETKVDIEKCKSEIIQMEKDFEKMAKEKSIKEAFLFYAADNAALNRFNLIYKGKKQITLYLDYVKLDGQLNWTPDFVDVSSSGDMAYTYGKYTYTHKDSTGNEVVNKGFFHTVWKKQADGKWKFVWD